MWPSSDLTVISFGAFIAYPSGFSAAITHVSLEPSQSLRNDQVRGWHAVDLNYGKEERERGG